jgi:hypothetical protein
MQTFAEAFREHLTAEPTLKRRGKRLLAIIDGPPSKRRTRQLDRMERHAVAALDDKHLARLGIKATALAGGGLGIDWSQVDWGKVLQTILEILMKILPLLLVL